MHVAFFLQVLNNSESSAVGDIIFCIIAQMIVLIDQRERIILCSNIFGLSYNYFTTFRLIAQVKITSVWIGSQRTFSTLSIKIIYCCLYK